MKICFSRDLISKLLQFLLLCILSVIVNYLLLFLSSLPISRTGGTSDLLELLPEQLADSHHLDSCGPRVSSVILLLPWLLLVRRGSFSLQLFADCVAFLLKSLIVVGFDYFLPCLPKPKTFKCLPCLSQ